MPLVNILCTSRSVITAQPAKVTRVLSSQARRCQSLNQRGQPLAPMWSEPSSTHLALGRIVRVYTHGDCGPRKNDESGRLDSFGWTYKQSRQVLRQNRQARSAINLCSAHLYRPETRLPAVRSRKEPQCAMRSPFKSPIREVLFGFQIEQGRRGGRARLHRRLVHLCGHET